MLAAVWMVLGILRIIGLVLLGILGLLFVLLLLVLLVPIRYQIQGSFDGKLKGQAGVSWLCRLLFVKAVYEKKLILTARVLGIRVFRMEKAFGKGTEETGEPEKDGPDEDSQKKGRQKGETGKASEEGPGKAEEKSGKTAKEAYGPGEKPTSEKEAGMPGEEPDRPEAEAGVSGEKPDRPGKEAEISGEEPGRPEAEAGTQGEEPHGSEKGAKASGQGTAGPEKKAKKQKKHKRKAKKNLKKKKERKKGKKKQKNRGFSFKKIYDKLKEILQGLKDRLDEWREKKEELAAFVNDEANRATFRLLMKQIWALCRHFVPTKAAGWVRFGFDDPYKTGQILTYISPFYGLYARKFQVMPVFGEKVLEGEGKLKGRIRIGTVLVIGLRMLLDKNFRVLLKKFLKR